METLASVVVDSIPVAHDRPRRLEPLCQLVSLSLLEAGVLVYTNGLLRQVLVGGKEFLPTRLVGGVIRIPAVHPNVLVGNGLVDGA